MNVARSLGLFGAEPEPTLTGEMQFLRWRFTAQDTTPVTDVTWTPGVV